MHINYLFHALAFMECCTPFRACFWWRFRRLPLLLQVASFLGLYRAFAPSVLLQHQLIHWSSNVRDFVCSHISDFVCSHIIAKTLCAPKLYRMMLSTCPPSDHDLFQRERLSPSLLVRAPLPLAWTHAPPYHPRRLPLVFAYHSPVKNIIEGDLLHPSRDRNARF